MTAWFKMVGRLMSEAASQSGLPPELSLSLVERHTYGVELSEGFVQCICFDILAGRPSFRVGDALREDYNWKYDDYEIVALENVARLTELGLAAELDLT